jgi:hypothetical protein
MDIRKIPKTRGIHLKTGTKIPDTSRHPRGYLDSVDASTITSSDWGLIVSGQYIVLDVDAPEAVPEDLEYRLPTTYVQTTKRGLHYVYQVPEGFEPSEHVNIKLKHNGAIYADVKVNGYIVGTGSTVDGFTYSDNARMPVEAPSWLLEAVKKPRHTSMPSGDQGRSGVPNGEHENFLFKAAAWARGQAGLSDDALFKFLRRGPAAVLEEVDEAQPFSDHDFARIARSAGRYEATDNITDTSLAPTAWRTALDVDTTLPLMDWLVYNFIPQRELSLVYGNGGIGKSTLASWLAANVLSRGGSFGFAGVEEPFARFIARTKLSAPHLQIEAFGRLVDISNTWRFPDDEDKLRSALEQYPLDVLYFDSIYTHFGTIQGHEGVRARTALSPLAAIAQEMGVTVIGTFHENKVGDLMGSVEMQNVCRVLLHATRPKGRPFRLSVKKTNFNMPEYDLQFNAASSPASALDGTPWLEKNEEGLIVPVSLHYLTNSLKVNQDSEAEDMPGEYNLENIEETPEETVLRLMQNHDILRIHHIEEETGWSHSKAGRYLKKIRGSLVNEA